MPLIEPPDLPDFIAALLPFERKAYELEQGDYAGNLIHFLDQGSRTGQVVFMLHGNPTWSFLWRKVMAHWILINIVVLLRIFLAWDVRVSRVRPRRTPWPRTST